jgi:hypothetical protein
LKLTIVHKRASMPVGGHEQLTILRENATVCRLTIGRRLSRNGGMPSRSSKRPRDPNQLAKLVIDLATGAVEEQSPRRAKNPAAVALGRLGGVKGGKARAAALSKEERAHIAARAARARWDKRAH